MILATTGMMADHLKRKALIHRWLTIVMTVTILTMFLTPPLARDASESLPFTIIASDSAYVLPHRDTYAGTIHELIVPLSDYGIQS